MADQSDTIARRNTYISSFADWIDFEIKISTDEDQIAMAPGKLVSEKTENGRRHFHYKMDQKMLNFFNICSGKYEIYQDKWNNVDLSIYYHKGHDTNLERMMSALKDGLDYYTVNFSPYQFDQVRILEFPRGSFAQSFANTIPFSEGVGFMQDSKKNDVDFTFYITAHEVAHQWWGHQVMEANVQGSAMLSETLAQYSTLMVMKEKFSEQQMQKFLRYELNRYLSGRTRESNKEQPIKYTEDQPYIHYRKGSLLMYALQDFIGEEQVNAALRDYIAEFAFKEAPYPTTTDLIGHFKAYTPDSLQYLITDLFETITLFENRTETATYKQLEDNQFEVNLLVNAKKYRADELGKETEIAFNDWIDIGLYGKNVAGKDSLLYLQKHLLVPGEQSINVRVSKKPVKAGVDPLNIMIDRNPSDNVIAVDNE